MTRNPFCRHYGRCLSDAAIADDKDLPCHQCEFRTDRTGRYDPADLPGTLALLLAIFCPDRVDDIRATTERIEAGLPDIMSALAGDNAKRAVSGPIWDMGPG